jgi:hypothetical protein
MLTAVSATFVCPVTLYASERAVSGCQCLLESHFTKRKYQHLSRVVNILVPVKYRLQIPPVSLAHHAQQTEVDGMSTSLQPILRDVTFGTLLSRSATFAQVEC